jgi:hypothetical protein
MGGNHVLLRVEPSGGREPVHADRIAGDRFRVLLSPGLVYGLAAGDVIRLGENGNFEVVERAGNLAIRVLTEGGVSGFETQLARDVAEVLGGRLDGTVRNGLAFTVPVRSGFAAVERLFGKFVAENPPAVWEYGNVYDAAGNQLGWWNEV